MPFHLWPTQGRPTRREFLAGLALGSAAIAIADPTPGRIAADEGWLALVSDTHIHADPRHKILGQTPTDNLRVVIADILSEPKAPAGVLINGDLALKDGRPGDYTTLLAALHPLRKARIPIHFALGNHDDRDTFRDVVLGTESDESEVEEKQVGAFEAIGHRFVVLDSLDKVNATPGRLGAAQLAWLGRELDAHRDQPTVIFVHHNPRSKHVPGLVDDNAFFAVVHPRPWVNAVVSGHTHRWGHSREGEVDLVSLPAVAYTFSGEQPLGYCRLRASDGQVRFELRDVVRKAEQKGRMPRRRPSPCPKPRSC